MKRLILLMLIAMFLSTGIAQAAVVDVTPWKKDVAAQADTIGGKFLTAAATGTDTLYIEGIHGIDNNATSITFAVTVASINTNVVLRLLQGQRYNNLANVDEDGADITITANGTYLFTVRDVISKGYFALYWVSESGGTTATIRITAKVG
jgi:hypothetical protein